MKPFLLPPLLRNVEFDLPIHDHAVRRLRHLRLAGLSDHGLADYAAIMQRLLGVDGKAALEEAKGHGPTNGYPFLVNAELKEARQHR
jgi:hypothetical protein